MAREKVSRSRDIVDTGSERRQQDMNFPIAPWRLAVLLLALAPFGFYLTAILAAVRWFHRERERTLPDFAPAVSLLKPVRGADESTYENFESFCKVDYPEFEILFCVNELSDPAVPLIHKLMESFPQRKIRLFSGAPQLGSNRKVNNLALIAHEARHEILVQSDGDVRVGRNYLRELAAPFSDSAVGVLSCFYRAIAARNFGAEIEAVGAASDFFAGALVADWTEGVTFALGASVATTKSWLKKIGGYEGLANVLADDYEIGNRIYKAGGKVLLSREAVWTIYPAQGLKGFWEHQVRWARTVRIVRPASYFGLLFTQGLPWTLLAMSVAPTGAIAAAYLLAYLVVRLTMAWVVGVWGIKDEVLRRSIWLVPVRDVIYFAVWVVGFLSRRVWWGGTQFEVRNGEMVEIGSRQAM
jgi:ceramide glucosyltransferase